MTDHHTTSINARDLSSRLRNLQSPTNDPTGTSTMSSEPRRPRASSCDSFRMPKFTKSSTMSTTDSSGSDMSQLHIARAVPKTRTNRQSVEIAAGEFSKPRVNRRSRRNTNASQRSARSEGGNGNGKEDFRYYGRHGNQWLFNDFSVTESIKKGWGKMFSKDEGDWYENRK